MKRIIIIATLLLACLPSFAQLNIKKQTESPVQVTTITMYWVWVYQYNNAYWLVLKSSNQFDNNYWLKLGTTKDECMATADGLLDLAETITDSDCFEIDNGLGESYRVTQYNALNIDGLWFASDGRAGGANIQKPYIKKLQRWCSTLQ